MSPSLLRLLSLVFMVAALPLLGLYGLLLMISTPNATGGMEPIVATVCYVAFTGIFGALTVVVLNFSRQLAREAKGEYTTP
jgi:TRAP-type C4-dicarboxylate transport system permease small subunit